VVVSASSALPEIVGGSGASALDSPDAFAAGVTTLLAAEAGGRRAAARARAERFGWPESVGRMLATLAG
jgi:alpha-1,6-mannosyltransferase